jgi:hypothetical protein
LGTVADRIGAPRTPRELLDLLGRYDRASGLQGLLDKVDWTSVPAKRLREGIVGHAPKMRARFPLGDPTGRDYAERLLVSSEFKKAIALTALQAFTDKRRLMMVHIPKCAGTDLIAKIASRYPTLSQHLVVQAADERRDMFELIAEFVDRVRQAQSMLVVGHIPLRAYVAAIGEKRTADRIFTVVRDPIDLVLSGVNYMVHLITSPVENRKGVQRWRALLGLPPSAAAPWKRAKELAIGALRHPEITPSNLLCRFLGSGTAKSAISLLAANNVEITDISRYDDWAKRAWSINDTTQRNRSKKIISRIDLADTDIESLLAITEEDRKLHERIMQALARSGTPSVFGREL